MVLVPGTTVGKGFTGQAKLSLQVTVAHQLTMKLVTENTGTKPFTYTCALHTYFAVKDIEDTKLLGLSGQYKDKTRNWAMLDTPSPYDFTEETDRVHLVTPQCLSIESGQHTTRVDSYGHDSIVVWNPWQANSKEMKDMTDHGYQTMLCVETAITQGMELMPGDQHALVQVVS